MGFKAMTYNILDGGVGREEMILSVIQTAQPDIVVLQEVYSVEFVQYLATSLRMAFFFGDGNARRHVSLLSRFPIISAQSYHPFPPITRNVVEAQVECNSGSLVRVIGVRPVANLWLPFELWRTWEARYIANLLHKYPKQPCLIMGDFNAIAPGDSIAVQSMPAWLRMMIWSQGGRPFSFSMQSYRAAGLIDCYRQLHPSDHGYTLPARNPNTRLDYAYATPALVPFLTTCRVIREPEVVFQASDHLPIVVEFN